MRTTNQFSTLDDCINNYLYQKILQFVTTKGSPSIIEMNLTKVLSGVFILKQKTSKAKKNLVKKIPIINTLRSQKNRTDMLVSLGLNVIDRIFYDTGINIEDFDFEDGLNNGNSGNFKKDIYLVIIIKIKPAVPRQSSLVQGNEVFQQGVSLNLR